MSLFTSCHVTQGYIPLQRTTMLFFFLLSLHLLLIPIRLSFLRSFVLLYVFFRSKRSDDAKPPITSKARLATPVTVRGEDTAAMNASWAQYERLKS